MPIFASISNGNIQIFCIKKFIAKKNAAQKTVKNKVRTKKCKKLHLSWRKKLAQRKGKNFSNSNVCSTSVTTYNAITPVKQKINKNK